ncbi:MAG: hypothetical protein ACTSVL_05470 [Promethearchaeota archaeon]
MDNQTKLPFIEISIISTTEKEISKKEILNIIKKRNDLLSFNKTSWQGSSAEPILRLDYTSINMFEKNYQNTLKLAEIIRDSILNGDISKEELYQNVSLRNKEKTNRNLDPYLILKYKTNYKDPMRENYNYAIWYADFFKENIYIEEVEDGFLHFYYEKKDYLNGNMNKLNFKELTLWLQKKNFHFPDKLMKKINDILNKN